jgi:hypothetical protein
MVTTLGRLGLPFGADQNLDTAALDFLEGIPAENLAHEWRPSIRDLLNIPVTIAETASNR